MDEVGDGAGGRQLLRAGDDDAVVALLDHTGIERGVALLVRGFAAVDLRRDDGVGGVEVVVTHVLIEGDDVVGKALPARRQHARCRGIAAKEAGDVIGRATHEAEGRFGPGLAEQPPCPQIGMAARNLVGPQHRLAGLGRDEGHALAHLRRGRDVIEARDRADRLAKGTMRGDVLHALAIDEDLPSVVERAKIFRTGSHQGNALCAVAALDVSAGGATTVRRTPCCSNAGHHGRAHVGITPSFRLQDFTPLAMSSTSFGGVIGVCAMRTPKGCNASSMAEMTAAAVGMVLTSPAPLAPSGLSGDGVSW